MHKEAYFTQETLGLKSQELIGALSTLRKKHSNLHFRPDAAALLVLDMQEYFLEEHSHAFIPSAPAIIPGIRRLMDSFASAGRPIVRTRHVNTPKNAGMMSKWWRDLINPRFAHSHYIERLSTQNSINFNKTQYDAFHHTALESTLRALGTEQVVVCGVMTHLCCETTARSAFMRGFEVYFTVDGTATYNEALHRASLLTLSHGFAIPVFINEILSQLEIYAI